MADDYTSAAGTFRAPELLGRKYPSVAVIDHPRQGFVYGFDSDLSTSQALPNLAAAQAESCTHALLTVESASGAGVRFREDGAAVAATPTGNADAGPLLVGGLSWVFTGPLADVRLIETAADVSIVVVYYRLGPEV